MKVSPDQPFQIIYSLFQHEYLGYLLESYIVQLEEKGRLTLASQNVSPQNAPEFAAGLDDRDFELIRLTEEIQQDEIARRFNKRKQSKYDFFLRVYDKDKGDESTQQAIEEYLDTKRGQILAELLAGQKYLYEMGRGGEVTWKMLRIQQEPATVRFHFRRTSENTRYHITVKHGEEKIELKDSGGIILVDNPAWLVVGDRVFHFQQQIRGRQLKPFLKRQHVFIAKDKEESYYRSYVCKTIERFPVIAKGFQIRDEDLNPQPTLALSEKGQHEQQLRLMGDQEEGPENGRMELELQFQYGKYRFHAGSPGGNSVEMEKKGEGPEAEYIFHRIKRNLDYESQIIRLLQEKGITIRHGKAVLEKAETFEWLENHKAELEAAGIGFEMKQNTNGLSGGKQYFLGESSISLEVAEDRDWFDIRAKVRFGPYEIPFAKIRKLILGEQSEFYLPNGEVAVIPQSWFVRYADLLAFSEENEQQDVKLAKHHLALVRDLELNRLAVVTMNRKLEQLRQFESIEDSAMPEGFRGELRPYQKAGYNWMQFLRKYRFGGCLADDMGLGKTIQTLALLQSEKEAGRGTSLLVLPTSLIYNWHVEAKRFTPKLKVFRYIGTQREKRNDYFHNFDLIITSYGIARIDIDLLRDFPFNYVILDESQAIKNPASNTAAAVRKLNAQQKLILTGTPLENSTMDLWSQMHFINPGLLGSQAFFRRHFLTPIEKKKDNQKVERLYNIIKPFILRRNKSQVAEDLPEKVENIQYCQMTPEQEELYENSKNYYRNQILESIEKSGMAKSQFILLQGLTKLRQLANHPRMVEGNETSTSGKMEDVIYKLDDVLKENHKVLIFSQFTSHLQIFREYFNSRGIRYNYLDGSTKDRQRQVETFQENPRKKVFLISLKAGGVGLNLTAADYVFMLDPWWNPATEAQAIDRAHRIGQKRNVFVYKFITRETVEEKILQLQAHKKQLAQNLITPEDSFVKTLTREDIANLLS